MYRDLIHRVAALEMEVEIVWTDEGDWSLSLVTGRNEYVITPTDKQYTKFTVLRITETVEVLREDVGIERVLEVA
jgi:hypothetical protein